MDFLPRTKCQVQRQVIIQKQRIDVFFDEGQVKEALLAKFGNIPIGPEGYFLTKDCEISCECGGVNLAFDIEEDN